MNNYLYNEFEVLFYLYLKIKSNEITYHLHKKEIILKMRKKFQNSMK